MKESVHYDLTAAFERTLPIPVAPSDIAQNTPSLSVHDNDERTRLEAFSNQLPISLCQVVVQISRAENKNKV